MAEHEHDFKKVEVIYKNGKKYYVYRCSCGASYTEEA